MVAKGYNQKYGIDYDETFCPVVRSESVRTFITLAAKHRLQLHQLDVANAFLNGNLKEQIYTKQPEQFKVKGNEHLVCKLKRSIYGLKQLRCWSEALDKELKKRVSNNPRMALPSVYWTQKEKSLPLLLMSTTSSWLEKHLNTFRSSLMQ